MSCDLQQATASADSWRAAETIMVQSGQTPLHTVYATSVSCVWSAQSGVVRCHCGCLQLLEYEAGSGRRAAAEDDEIPGQ